MTKRVIIFGPLFTQAERIWNKMLKTALEKNSRGALKVTLPQDEAKQFIKDGRINFDAIYKHCLCNALQHDIAIAVLDGPDADSGTCIEIGWRKGTNIFFPIIGVRTDLRSSEDGGLNAMLRICDEIIYFPAIDENVNRLARKIIARIKKLEKKSSPKK